MILGCLVKSFSPKTLDQQSLTTQLRAALDTRPCDRRSDGRNCHGYRALQHWLQVSCSALKIIHFVTKRPAYCSLNVAENYNYQGIFEVVTGWTIPRENWEVTPAEPAAISSTNIRRTRLFAHTLFLETRNQSQHQAIIIGIIYISIILCCMAAAARLTRRRCLARVAGKLQTSDSGLLNSEAKRSHSQWWAIFKTDKRIWQSTLASKGVDIGQYICQIALHLHSKYAPVVATQLRIRVSLM